MHIKKSSRVAKVYVEKANFIMKVTMIIDIKLKTR